MMGNTQHHSSDCHFMFHNILIRILIYFVLIIICIRRVGASFPCNKTRTCAEYLWIGSECIDGYCTNPFQMGCLRNVGTTKPPKKQGSSIPSTLYRQLRTCNSEDPIEAHNVVCSPADPDLNYMEIRIMSQNWESAFFETWIIQIVLSEMLGVPTSVESGMPDAKLNFYHPTNSLQYGESNIWNAIRQAAAIHNHQRKGDCTVVKNNGNQYTPCAHFVPEVWQSGKQSEVKQLQNDRIIEAPEAMGAVGQISWYVPKFVLDRDPTITHFRALAGEKNRIKLAKMFLRPTSWGDYCLQVSKTNCTKPDNVALRSPQDENERKRYYFADGGSSNGVVVYTGYFRATHENSCAANPKTCTGHITEWPCDWSSHLLQQAYHNRIALKSSGPLTGNAYSYQQLVDIWYAANATKSNLMMYWWEPEILLDKFIDTDAEFTRVILPQSTQDCVDARITSSQRCPCTQDGINVAQLTSMDNSSSCNIEHMKPNVRYGKPEGRCADEPKSLTKIIASVVQEVTYEAHEALRSPAYDVLKSFSISQLQIAKIIDYLEEAQERLHGGGIEVGNANDLFGFHAREAVCRWAAENVDDLQMLIPRFYPRVVHHQNTHEQLLFHVATFMGSAALIMVIMSTIYIYLNRTRKVLRFAQIEFLFLKLSGLGMVSAGSILLVLQPSDRKCMAAVWLVTLGYTLEFIPLIVKVAAMNRLMEQSKHFKRVKLQRSGLFFSVFVVSIFISAFLLAMTIIDREQPASQFLIQPAGATTPNNNNDTANDATITSTATTVTIVNKYDYCKSNSQIWRNIRVIWQCCMLISATILAIQTRHMRQDFNESQVLGLMVYSHSFFVIFGLITFILENATSLQNVLSAYRSLTYSIDTIVTIIIYFLPKFVTSDDDVNAGRLQDTWIGKHATVTARTLQLTTFGSFSKTKNIDSAQLSSSISSYGTNAQTTNHSSRGNNNVTRRRRDTWYCGVLADEDQELYNTDDTTNSANSYSNRDGSRTELTTIQEMKEVDEINPTA